MKVTGTIGQLSFLLLCFTSLVFILIIQYLNLWNLTVKREEAVNNLLYENSNLLKKFKSKKEFSIEEIDEISENNEFIRQMFEQDSKRLLYLNNLTYLIEPDQSEIDCNTINQDTSENGLDLIIVINSKWSNFERRQRARESWLNRDNIVEQVCYFQLKSSLPILDERESKSSSGKSFFPIRKIVYLFALGKPEYKPTKISKIRKTTKKQSRQHHLHKLLNRPSNNGNIDADQIMIDSRILNEFNRFRDLLVINLDEQYKSMSIKHLSIFKWILRSHYHQSSHQHRQNVSNEQSSYKYDDKLSNILVLKCDDDADIDLSQLIQFYHQDEWRYDMFSQFTSDKPGSFPINNEHDNNSSFFINPTKSGMKQASESRKEANWIMCARFPHNTPVFRAGSGRKWQITRSEYHFDTYPAYCSGLAYMAPLLLLKRLFILSHIFLWNDAQKSYMKPLWVDDVFITGILFAALIESDRARIVSLNAHFCYTRAHQSRRLKLNAPCMVSEVQ